MQVPSNPLLLMGNFKPPSYSTHSIDAGEFTASDEDRNINLHHIRALVNPELFRDWRSPIHLICIFDTAGRFIRLDDEVFGEVEVRHAEHASSTELLAVDVSLALPWYDSGEMRWSKGCDVPLDDCERTVASHADFTVTPRHFYDSLDNIVAVFCILRAHKL